MDQEKMLELWKLRKNPKRRYTLGKTRSCDKISAMKGEKKNWRNIYNDTDSTSRVPESTFEYASIQYHIFLFSRLQNSYPDENRTGYHRRVGVSWLNIFQETDTIP